MLRTKHENQGMRMKANIIYYSELQEITGFPIFPGKTRNLYKALLVYMRYIHMILKNTESRTHAI